MVTVRSRVLSLSLIFLAILIFGGFFVWQQSGRSVDRAILPAASAGAVSGIEFMHPIYGYSLVLPYSWKGKYRVVESATSTSFWYLSDDIQKDYLFSIVKIENSEALVKKQGTKKLADRDGLSFAALFPERLDPTDSALNSDMRRDVYGIMETFRLAADGRQQKIKEKLSQVGASSSGILPITAFEIVATEEKATSSDYYILARQQNWHREDGSLRGSSKENWLAIVVFSKDTEEIIDFKKEQKFEQIFPKMLRSNVLLSPDSLEYQAMIFRLDYQLDEEARLYFGQEVVSTSIFEN